MLPKQMLRDIPNILLLPIKKRLLTSKIIRETDNTMYTVLHLIKLKEGELEKLKSTREIVDAFQSEDKFYMLLNLEDLAIKLENWQVFYPK